MRVYFTVYSFKADWWVNINIYFEYGIESQVITNMQLIPFKPSHYELGSELNYYILEFCQKGINMGLCILFLVLDLCKYRNYKADQVSNKKFTFADFFITVVTETLSILAFLF